MAEPRYPRTEGEIQKEFDSRVSRISKEWDEKKHKRDAVGKFANKTASEREDARKLKAIKRKIDRINERWGTTPEERERALKSHAGRSLSDAEIKQIEDELMATNGVKDRKQLYSDYGLFDKLQESIANRQSRRAGEKARQSDYEAQQKRGEERVLAKNKEAERRRRYQRNVAATRRAQAMKGAANPRTFPVPATIASAWLGDTATLDELDLAARHDTEAGEWARRVLRSERDGVLVGALGGSRTLPFGVVMSVDEIDVDVVVALATPGRGIIAGAIPDDTSVEYLTLDEDEVAFALRAFNVDKASGVILRAATPVAFLTRTVEPESREDALARLAAGELSSTALPAGARLIAIVDPLDKNAVLDLVAVLPGPKVLRRNDGKWEPDPSWVNILRSVRPPPVVEVTDALAASVVTQVDEATRGQPFEKTVLASGERELFVAELEDVADRAALSLLPILAAQGRIKSEVYDVAGVMPAQLQRYWIAGPGAAKIRWGTPGAWRRCHRELSKYMGPIKAKGACTNLGQKLGGRGVAWDVGRGAKKAARAIANAAS